MISPHLALVFSSEGLNQLFDAERLTHQHRDPLEAAIELIKTKHDTEDEQIPNTSGSKVSVVLLSQFEECRASHLAGRQWNLKRWRTAWELSPSETLFKTYPAPLILEYKPFHYDWA